MTVDVDTPLTLAVYGASGALGQQVLFALEGEALPIETLLAVGGPTSAGGDATFRSRRIDLLGTREVPIDSLDAALLCQAGPAAESAALRQELVDRGVFVVDATRSGRTDRDVPLVWPGTGPKGHTVGLDDHPGAVAVPCGVPGALAPILRALHGVAPVTRVEATVLQGASSAGRDGIDTLSKQTVSLLSARGANAGPLGVELAFNAMPGVYSRDDDADEGPDGEASGCLAWEAATIAETRRLLPELAAGGSPPVRLTPLRVPVFTGEGLALTVWLDGEPPALADVGTALGQARGLEPRVDGPTLREATDSDDVLVGSLRVDSDGAVRLFAALDPPARTAGAITQVLAEVVRRELW